MLQLIQRVAHVGLRAFVVISALLPIYLLWTKWASYQISSIDFIWVLLVVVWQLCVSAATGWFLFSEYSSCNNSLSEFFTDKSLRDPIGFSLLASLIGFSTYVAVIYSKASILAAIVGGLLALILIAAIVYIAFSSGAALRQTRRALSELHELNLLNVGMVYASLERARYSREESEQYLQNLLERGGGYAFRVSHELLTQLLRRTREMSLREEEMRDRDSRLRREIQRQAERIHEMSRTAADLQQAHEQLLEERRQMQSLHAEMATSLQSLNELRSTSERLRDLPATLEERSHEFETARHSLLHELSFVRRQLSTLDASKNELATSLANAVETVTRYTNVGFPKHCRLNTPVLLTIQLVVDVPKDSIVNRLVEVPIIDDLGHVVLTVFISTAGFDVSTATASMRVPINHDSDVATFQLTPRRSGTQLVEIELFFQTERVGYLTIESEVVEDGE